MERTKVQRLDVLELGWEKVRSNGGAAGVDGLSVERFAEQSYCGCSPLKSNFREAPTNSKVLTREPDA